jgi:hypothetical protein
MTFFSHSVLQVAHIQEEEDRIEPQVDRFEKEEHLFYN